MATFSTISLDEARKAVLPPRRATQAQYQDYVRGLSEDTAGQLELGPEDHPAGAAQGCRQGLGHQPGDSPARYHDGILANHGAAEDPHQSSSERTAARQAALNRSGSPPCGSRSHGWTRTGA